MTKIGVILGSMRTKSLGGRIFNYLRSTMPDTDDVTYEWINLADYDLPMFGQSASPLGEDACDLNSEEARWVSTIGAQDGYIIISPEYNAAAPGFLKNALDYFGKEVARKPIQVVTYAHAYSGGQLAAESLVRIFNMLHMFVMPTPLLLGRADEVFVGDGELLEDTASGTHFKKRFAQSFDELTFYARLLVQNPYSYEEKQD